MEFSSMALAMVFCPGPHMAFRSNVFLRLVEMAVCTLDAGRVVWFADTEGCRCRYAACYGHL